MLETEDGPRRRAVLQGAAAAVGVAGLGSAAAKKSDTEPTDARKRELTAEFRDPRRVSRAVHEQTELLNELADDGVLPNGRVNNLTELSEPADGEGELVTVAQFNTQFTPRIKVFRKVERGYLSVSVFPEMDAAHAVLNPTEDGEPLGEGSLKTYGSMPDVEPQGCLDPGHCQDCDCNTVCCTEDPYTGDCLQYCNQCDCSCVCCDCGFLCSSYC